MQQITGVAGGVPYVALPPEGRPEGTPLVVVWHLHDPPRSETAMAAALPLKGLPAWRVYLGLPLSGSCLPEGGLEAFFQLSYEDAVLKAFDPTCRQAVDEFPSALATLRQALPVGDGPLGLVGGSVGALVALRVLAETDLPVGAVALVSPAIRLAAVVAVEEGIRGPAEQLWQVLSRHAPDRTALTSIPEMAHALAKEPGLDPAPRPPTPHAWTPWRPDGSTATSPGRGQRDNHRVHRGRGGSGEIDLTP